MTRNSFWTTMSKVLTAVTVMLTVTLILATSAAAEYKILYQFKNAKYGADPTILIMDASGSIYGVAEGGGAYNCGTVFKLTPHPDGSWTERVLYNFTASDGASPRSGLVFDAAGNLYGEAAYGGNDQAGFVYKLTHKLDGSWTKSVLYNFTGGADGATPLGGLVFDAAGNLYGAAWQGGMINTNTGVSYGVVFKLTPNPGGTWTESVIYSFLSQTGPHEVAFDALGNLYGTTDTINVFKLTPNSDGTWTDSDFGFGFGIFARMLTVDTVDNLYVTAVGFDAVHSGYVFKLKSNPDGTWTQSLLHSFTGADGADPSPSAPLIVDAAGNLYGTTVFGGSCSSDVDGCGVVFKLSPTSSGWSETVLHSFTGYGKYPDGGVIMDAAGTLYGTVSQGTGNYGFVYEIMKNCIDHTFVMPVNGTLYLQQKGGDAGASTELGIGTSPTNFVKYYSGLPNNPDPVGEVLVGTFTKGTIINFGMLTQFGSQSGWAFTSGSTRASVVAFSDVDNSLHMGGKILQQLSPTTWLLHLDDALSYLYDDDDNDVLMQIRIVPQ